MNAVRDTEYRKKERNHAFANCAGVVIIIVTLFICFRNMSSFITSVSKLIGA